MKQILLFLIFSTLFVVSAFPHETTTLCMDKECYEIGDTVNFIAKIQSDEPVASRVVYVELLSPEGAVEESRVLFAQDGKAKGQIVLKKEYWTGLHEVRSYTRYAISQNPNNYYSRVIPVYELVKGIRGMKNRIRDDENYQYLTCPLTFDIKPEQGLMVRGKVVRLDDYSKGISSLPITIVVDSQTYKCETDKNGQFSFNFGHLQGVREMMVLYDYHLLPKKEKACIILDDTFSPKAKKYNKEEKCKTDGFTLQKEECYKNELRPSFCISTRQVLNDYLDRMVNLDYFYEKERKVEKDNIFPSLYLLMDYSYFCDESFRIVNLKHPINNIDSLREEDCTLHDGNGDTFLEDYQFAYIVTDKRVCERFSYNKFSPENLRSNVSNLLDGHKMISLGLGSLSVKGGIPSCLMFLVPYKNGQVVFNKSAFSMPYIRRVTLHGFSY